MKKSQLLVVFDTLTEQERREFKKWLNSPVHNRRGDVRKLYDYLNKYRKKSGQYLEKEIVFRRMFDKKTPFNDNQMRQTMFLLLKNMEEYLIINEFKKDEVRYNLLWSRVMRKRSLDKYFDKAIKASRGKNAEKKLKDKDALQAEFDIAYENFRFQSKARRTAPLELQSMSDSLDKSFLAHKLSLACSMLSHQRVYKQEYDYGILGEGLLTDVEKHNWLELPGISLYYYMYLTMIKPDEGGYFFELKKRLFMYGDSFTITEIREAYIIAINYCIKKLNNNEDMFRREAFDLYDKGYKDDILLVDGEISNFGFINAVLIAINIGEFEWTVDFIRKYSDYLPIDKRSNSVNYCWARYYYQVKNYEKALEKFENVDYIDILLNLNAKTFLLKIYYDSENFEALESLLLSMRAYLNRKEVVGYHRENYKNIISYIKKLMQVNRYDKKDLMLLKSNVEMCTPLTEKDWILNKIERLL